MDRQHYGKNKKGYVTLVSAIILSIISTLIVTGNILINTDSVQNVSITESSKIAKSYADMCAENAINKLKIDLNYTGNETINISNGSCTIRAITGSGNTNRTIETTGVNRGITKRIRIIISEVNPLTQITSWAEVSSF